MKRAEDNLHSSRATGSSSYLARGGVAGVACLVAGVAVADGVLANYRNRAASNSLVSRCGAVFGNSSAPMNVTAAAPVRYIAGREWQPGPGNHPGCDQWGCPPSTAIQRNSCVITSGGVIGVRLRSWLLPTAGMSQN